MTPQTMFSLMNETDIDFDEDFCPTLADAIGYVEFEEDLHNWEDSLED